MPQPPPGTCPPPCALARLTPLSTSAYEALCGGLCVPVPREAFHGPATLLPAGSLNAQGLCLQGHLPATVSGCPASVGYPGSSSPGDAHEVRRQAPFPAPCALCCFSHPPTQAEEPSAPASDHPGSTYTGGDHADPWRVCPRHTRAQGCSWPSPHPSTQALTAWGPASAYSPTPWGPGRVGTWAGVGVRGGPSISEPACIHWPKSGCPGRLPRECRSSVRPTPRAAGLFLGTAS